MRVIRENECAHDRSVRPSSSSITAASRDGAIRLSGDGWRGRAHPTIPSRTAGIPHAPGCFTYLAGELSVSFRSLFDSPVWSAPSASAYGREQTQMRMSQNDRRRTSRCPAADVVTVRARRHSVSAQRLPHCRAGRELRLRLAHDRAPRHRATAPRSTRQAGYCAPKASWLTLYDCVASSCRPTLQAAAGDGRWLASRHCFCAKCARRYIACLRCLLLGSVWLYSVAGRTR